MLAFLGIAATNVLGLLVIAAKYVFPSRPWWMEKAYEERATNKSKASEDD